jgi:hypothetical protein
MKRMYLVLVPLELGCPEALTLLISGKDSEETDVGWPLVVVGSYLRYAFPQTP